MFIYRVKQPAVRLSLRVPITPTFSENCVPKQTELTFVFISFAHDADKHSGLQALLSMHSNFQLKGKRLKMHMLLCHTVQSQIGYKSYMYASTNAHPFLRHILA